MKNLYFTLILLFLTIFNCSDGSESVPQEPEEVIEDIIKPPYTVRYEVTFSSNAVNYTTEISFAHEYPVGTWRVASAQGTRDVVSNSELINGWTKEFTVTVNKNPLTIACNVAYNPEENATVRTKMYVNGELVKDTTWPRSPSSSSTPTYYDDHYNVY